MSEWLDVGVLMIGIGVFLYAVSKTYVYITIGQSLNKLVDNFSEQTKDLFKTIGGAIDRLFPRVEMDKDAVDAAARKQEEELKKEQEEENDEKNKGSRAKGN